MSRTKYLSDIIFLKYGSVRKFAQDVGIPYSTLKSGLERGLDGMAVETVIKICDALNIKIETVFNVNNQVEKQPERRKLISKINRLNEDGCKLLSLHADGLIANNEYSRSCARGKKGSA
jgi:DNA-binding XRE family transcriptional regulator